MIIQRRIRNLMTKCFAILLLVSAPLVFDMKAQTTGTENVAVDLLQKRIGSFLTVWLIKRNNEKALESFSQNAFSNAEILNESCAGYIKTNQRSQPNQVKEGIKQFLKDFSSDNTNKTLDDWLTKNNKTFNEDIYKASAISLPQTTRYWLYNSNFEVLKSILECEKRLPYLSKYLGIKTSVILIAELNLNVDREKTTGYVYFIWSKENKDWKIVHVGIFCQ